MTLPATAGVYADTISTQANMSEVIDVMIATAEALELEFAVMSGLVTRVEIPNGADRVRIPYQDSTFVVQPHTDGDEISVVQRFSLDTLELTATELQLSYRISATAMRLSTQDLGAMAGDEFAKAQQERLEVDLLSLLDDTGSQDLGSSGANTTLDHVRNARTLLKNVARAQGGPARQPVVLVINPIQEDHLLADLGVTAATAAVAGANGVQRAAGISDELLNSPWFIQSLLKVPVFSTGYVATTVGSVTSPSIGGMFSKRALLYGVSKDWDMKVYDESHWPGLIVRGMAHYGSRLGPFPQHVVQFDTDVSTL